LQEHTARPSGSRPASAATNEPSSPSSSRASLFASKLRYTAYEPPPPAGRLRDRASSGGSSTSASRASSQLSGTSGGQPLEELSRTVTAGDLTLAAAAQTFEMAAVVPKVSPVERLVRDATSSFNCGFNG
jgi:AP-4 complex subunit epsilon-1